MLVTTISTKCVCQRGAIGGACGTCGGGRKIHVGGGSLDKIDDSEDLDVDGSLIFR